MNEQWAYVFALYGRIYYYIKIRGGHYLWVGEAGVLQYLPCTEILPPCDSYAMKFCPPLNFVHSNYVSPYFVCTLKCSTPLN